MIPRSSKAVPIVSFVAVVAVCLLLAAGLQIHAAPRAQQAAPDLDAELRALIAQHNLTGDPAADREIPLVTEPIVQLGKLLFFTKALGGDMDSACASCHLPTMGGGDDSPLPIGVGALDPDLIGPGRMHPSGNPTVPRNAPTTFNMALWDKVVFHDGRIESLDKITGANGGGPSGIHTPDVPYGEADPWGGQNLAMAQSRFPTTSDAEMRGFEYEAGKTTRDLRARLAARLGGYGDAANELDDNQWPALFEVVFGPAESLEELVTEQRIAFAIGEYERSQLFINTPWSAYVKGDETAISDAAKRGAQLFYTAYEDGGANCVKCHLGDFFTDEGFHVLAVPQIGPGKGDGVTGTDDYGRFRVTRQLADLYAFRTPSLLNVTVTGPWGHDGAYTTLEGTVRHMLNPVDAATNFAWDELDPYIQQEYGPANTAKAVRRLQYNRQRGLDTIQDVDLTDAEVADLVAFLETLTDPCVTSAACLAPWMPSAFDVDPDGERLNAKTATN